MTVQLKFFHLRFLRDWLILCQLLHRLPIRPRSEAFRNAEDAPGRSAFQDLFIAE